MLIFMPDREIKNITKYDILKMSRNDFVDLFKNKIKLGIFVADGSRRMVISRTDTVPGSVEFYKYCAKLPCQSALKFLDIMFGHGVGIVVCPILSRAVLESRGELYQRYTISGILEELFISSQWFSYYYYNEIRVSVYGDINSLQGTLCEKYITPILDVITRTSHFSKHHLLFGIGESPYLGAGIPEQVIDMYKDNGRIPTRDEIVKKYYGVDLPFADFYIMTSKMSSFGAIPRFLIDGGTEFYFLPNPIGEGMTEGSFREIVYDAVCLRKANRDAKYMKNSFRDNIDLKNYFDKSIGEVIGLGKCINGIWVFM